MYVFFVSFLFVWLRSSSLWFCIHLNSDRRMGSKICSTFHRIYSSAGRADFRIWLASETDDWIQPRYDLFMFTVCLLADGVRSTVAKNCSLNWKSSLFTWCVSYDSLTNEWVWHMAEALTTYINSTQHVCSIVKLKSDFVRQGSVKKVKDRTSGDRNLEKHQRLYIP